MSDAQLLLEGAAGAVVALRSPASGLFYAPGEAEVLVANSATPVYALVFVNRGGLVGFSTRADDDAEAVHYLQASRTRPFRLTLDASAFTPFAQFAVASSQSDAWEGRSKLRLQLASRMLPQFEWSVELVPEMEGSRTNAERDVASSKLLLFRDAVLQHVGLRRAILAKRRALEAWWHVALDARRRRTLLQRAVLQLADRIVSTALLGWEDVTVRRRRQRALVAAFVRRSQLRTLFHAFRAWCNAASAERARLGALLYALRRLEPARILSLALNSWAQMTAVRRRHRLVVANMHARRRLRLLTAIMSSWSLEATLARSSTDHSHVLAVAESQVGNLQLLAGLQRAQTLSVAIRILARAAQRRAALRALLGWAQHARAARLSGNLLRSCTAALLRRRCRLVLERWAHATAEAHQQRALVSGLRLRLQRRIIAAALRCWGQIAADEARERELSQAHEAVLQMRLVDLDGIDALRSRCVATLLHYNERRRTSQLLLDAWSYWLQYVRDRQRCDTLVRQLSLRRHVRLLRASFTCWRARALSVALAETLLQRHGRRRLVASLRAWSVLASALLVQRTHAERFAILHSKQLVVRAFERWHSQANAGRAERSAAESSGAAQQSLSLARESLVAYYLRRGAVQLASRVFHAWNTHAAGRSRRRWLAAHTLATLVKRRLHLVLESWRDMAASAACRRRRCDTFIRWRQRRALYACFDAWAEEARHEVGVRREARNAADEHAQLVIAHTSIEAESAGLYENCVTLFLRLRSRRLLRVAFDELLRRVRFAHSRRALLDRTVTHRRRRCMLSCMQSWAVVARQTACERLLLDRAASLYKSRTIHAVFHAWFEHVTSAMKRDVLVSALDVVAERWCSRALVGHLRSAFHAWSELVAAASARNGLVSRLYDLQRRRMLSECLAWWVALVQQAKRARARVEHATRTRRCATLRRVVVCWARLALAGRSQRIVTQERKRQHEDAARWCDKMVSRTRLQRRSRCLRVLFDTWIAHVQWKQASLALSEKLATLASVRRTSATFLSWKQLAVASRWRSSVLVHAISVIRARSARRTLWGWFRVAVLATVEGVQAAQEKYALGMFIRGRLSNLMRAWCSHAARSRCLSRLSSRAALRVRLCRLAGAMHAWHSHAARSRCLNRISRRLALRLQHRFLLAALHVWQLGMAQQSEAASAADAMAARHQRRFGERCFLAWRETAMAEASARVVLSLQSKAEQLQLESADRWRTAEELSVQLGELQRVSSAGQARAEHALAVGAQQARELVEDATVRLQAAAALALLRSLQRRNAARCFRAWAVRTRAKRSLALLLQRACAASSRIRLQLSLCAWAKTSAHKQRRRSLVAVCERQRRRRAVLAALRWWAAVAAEQLQERRLADLQQSAEQHHLNGLSALVELYERRSWRQTLMAAFAAWLQCWQLARLCDASEQHMASRISSRRLCSAFVAWASLARQSQHWSVLVRNCRLRRMQLAAHQSLRAWTLYAAASTRNRHLQEQFVRRRLEKARAVAFRAWQAAAVARVCRAVAFNKFVDRLRRRQLAARFLAWASYAAEARAQRARREEEAALLEETPTRVSSQVYLMAVARTAAELWVRKMQRRTAARLLHAWARYASAAIQRAALLRRAVTALSARRSRIVLAAWIDIAAHKRRRRSLVAACERQRRRRAVLAALRWWAAVAAEQLQERRLADLQQSAEQHHLNGLSALVELYERRSWRQTLMAAFAAWLQCWQLARLCDASEQHMASRISRRRLCSAFVAWASLARQSQHWSVLVRNCRLRRMQLAAHQSLRAWTLYAAASTRNRHLQEQFGMRRKQRAAHAVLFSWAAVASAEAARDQILDLLLRRAVLQRLQTRLRLTFDAWFQLARDAATCDAMVQQRRDAAAATATFYSWRDQTWASVAVVRQHYAQHLLQRVMRAWSASVAASQLRVTKQMTAEQAAARHDLRLAAHALRAWQQIAHVAQLLRISASQLMFSRVTNMGCAVLQHWCQWSRVCRERRSAAAALLSRREAVLRREALLGWRRSAAERARARAITTLLAERRSTKLCYAVMREWRCWCAAHSQSRASMKALMQAAGAAWRDKAIRAAWAAWASAARGASLSRGRFWAGSVSLSSWQQLALVSLQAWSAYTKRSQAENRRLVAHAFVGWRFAAAVAGAAA